MRLLLTSWAVLILAGIGARAASPPATLQAKPNAARNAPGRLLQNPVPVSEDSVKAGRLVYSKYRRGCHGPQGKGDGVAPPGSVPPNLVDAQWKVGSSDGEIFLVIKDGIPPYEVMRPWGRSLSDTDLWNTVNYLRSLARTAGEK
jgi:putative copper resistance protein D